MPLSQPSFGGSQRLSGRAELTCHSGSKHETRQLSSFVMLVIAAGIALRVALALLFPELGSFLDGRVECITPVSSYTRLLEGLYLYQRGMSPYSGDIFYQSPLLLSLFATLPRSEFLVDCFYALIEGLGAYCLARVASRRPQRSYSPGLVASLYLLNPFSLMGGLAKSTNVFSNCAIAASLAAASGTKPGLAMALLGLAASLSWYPLYFLVPVVVLCEQHSYRTIGASRLVLLFVAAVGIFQVLSSLPLLSLDYIKKLYGTQLLLRDMTRPNIGLWWYFFIEMFAAFRPFFLGLFQLFIGVFPLSLTLRFPNEPLFVISCITGLLAAFKPYPEVSDIGFYLSVLALNKNVVQLMRFKLFVVLGLLYISALGPTFYNLWTYVGSGNANFFYAITLVYALTISLALTESIWAAVRLDYDGGRNKNLLQI